MTNVILQGEGWYSRVYTIQDKRSLACLTIANALVPSAGENYEKDVLCLRSTHAQEPSLSKAKAGSQDGNLPDIGSNFLVYYAPHLQLQTSLNIIAVVLIIQQRMQSLAERYAAYIVL